MIRSSAGPGPDQLRYTLIVAYDPADGRIHGTALHGSFGDEDRAGISQSEARLRETLTQRTCDPGIIIETIILPSDELGDKVIDRIDPATKTIIPLEHDAANPLAPTRPWWARPRRE
jgi:hypothetical protein